MRSSGARDRCVETPGTNNPDSPEDIGQYLDRMVIERFTPDRHKIVFKEMGDEHPNIDVDKSDCNEQNPSSQCLQENVQILEPEQATEPTQLVNLSPLGTECAMQTIRQTRNKTKAHTLWHSG